MLDLERLKWEKEFDCIAKMRQWILEFELEDGEGGVLRFVDSEEEMYRAIVVRTINWTGNGLNSQSHRFTKNAVILLNKRILLSIDRNVGVNQSANRGHYWSTRSTSLCLNRKEVDLRTCECCSFIKRIFLSSISKCFCRKR